MAISEARKKANRKWDEAHRADYWRCTVVFPVNEKNMVIAQAEKSGKTISEYIRGLIQSDAERGADYE